MSSPRHRTGDRRAGGVRSAVYLLCFALVPVFGAAWVGADAWTASRDAAATTRTTGAEVDEFVRLNKLRSALVDERYFAGAVSGVRELGIDPALVRQITGIDIDEKLRDARAAVDALVGSLPLPGVDRDLVGVRSLNLGSVAIGTGYDEIQHALLAKGDLAFASLQHRARTIGADAGGDAIADALDRLDAATRAREAVSSELTSRLATLFGARVGAADATQALIEEHAAYHQAMLTVARTTADGPAPGLLDALAVLRTTGAVVAFERDVEDAIAARLSPAAGSGAGSGIQQEIGAAGEVYRAGLGSADAHLLLIDAAGHDVEAGVRHALDEQSDAARRTMVTLLAGALVLLAFAIAVALSLGRPMRRLADLARAISAGEPVRVERAVGPAEVREATLALDAAAQHLRTVEAQARALARGDLDDEVLQRPTSGALGASLQEAVRTLASSMNEREEFRRRLAHEAATDGLTQLANRSASLHQLHRSLARSRRAESTVALLYLDVDGFKAINDTFGHPAGDAVLRTVAQRLVTRSREGDHVGRLGGDEFVVIAEPVSGIDEARALAERLLAAIEEPVELEHQRVRVSASIGIALGDRADLTADELLRDADLAVYEAKANGRGRVELCNDELRSELAAQFDLDQALRAAVAQGELVVHYQPIVQTTSGEVLGL